MAQNGQKKENKPAAQGYGAYYDLKESAVDRLVGADKSAPSYSSEELNRYRSKKALRIPLWVKIPLLKAWFAGAVCFFFLWGLGTYVTAQWDMMLVLCAAMGLANDLLVNPVIRFMEKTPGDNSRWMMFPQKHWVSLFLNIVYFTFVLICVYALYNAVNVRIAALTGRTEEVALGVEPILFGILTMAFDLLFISIKNGFITVFRDAKTTAGGREKRGG